MSAESFRDAVTGLLQQPPRRRAPEGFSLAESPEEPQGHSVVAEPLSAEYHPEPESQPVPAPGTDHEAKNRTLRRKLRIAVAAANGCARTMAKEQDEAREKVRKLEWALFLERAAHQRRKENPMCTPLMPTHAEVRARMVAEEEKKKQEEHTRQAQVELDLRTKLAQAIERKKEKKHQDREDKKKTVSTKLATSLARKQPLAAHLAAAKALAVSRGHQLPTFTDFRDCHLAPPRPVEKPRTISATSTSLEHCTPFSSGRECQ